MWALCSQGMTTGMSSRWHPPAETSLEVSCVARDGVLPLLRLIPEQWRALHCAHPVQHWGAPRLACCVGAPLLLTQSSNSSWACCGSSNFLHNCSSLFGVINWYERRRWGMGAIYLLLNLFRDT